MDRHTEIYLEGLASFDVVFMQAAPGGKRTTRTWDYFENLHEQRCGSRLDLVHDWMKKGYGVGYLPRKRLAAIDADNITTVRRVQEFEDREGYLYFPKVFTPSGGVHAHFQHPPDLDLSRVKNHVCHPVEDGEKVPWDFKLGERTMLMAPGTVMPKGVYQAGIWLPPPILDVRFIAPELDIFKVDTPFLRDTRPWEDRVMRAMTYLRLRAPVNHDGKGRSRALRRVAEHLVGFLDLEIGLVFHLMTTSKPGKTRAGQPTLHKAWNDRVLDNAGKPAPFDDDAILSALEDAQDAVPAYGVILLKKTQAKGIARAKAEEFIEILTFLPEPRGDLWITKDALYGSFLEFTGVKHEAYDKCELGLAINNAIRNGRLPFMEDDRGHAGRIYRGLDANTLRIAIDAWEQRRKALQAAS